MAALWRHITNVTIKFFPNHPRVMAARTVLSEVKAVAKRSKVLKCKCTVSRSPSCDPTIRIMFANGILKKFDHTATYQQIMAQVKMVQDDIDHLPELRRVCGYETEEEKREIVVPGFEEDRLNDEEDLMEAWLKPPVKKKDDKDKKLVIRRKRGLLI